MSKYERLMSAKRGLESELEYIAIKTRTARILTNSHLSADRVSSIADEVEMSQEFENLNRIFVEAVKEHKEALERLLSAVNVKINAVDELLGE